MRKFPVQVGPKKVYAKFGDRLDSVPKSTPLAGRPDTSHACDVVTYVARCGEYVKIGRTQVGNIANRLSTMRVGNPYDITIVDTLYGDYEAMLHDKFAMLRHRGEWFRDDGTITRFFASMK